MSWRSMRSRAVRSKTWASGSATRASASRAQSASSTGSSTTRTVGGRVWKPPGGAWTWSAGSAASGWPRRRRAATDQPMTDLLKIADRYRALLELGDQIGVVPQVEVWGSSRTLGRLGEAAMVAIEAGHPKACILPDVYHLYRGGSDFGGIKLLAPTAIHVFHFNDYPADPPRKKLTDADRVYPGDGVAPLKSLLHDLSAGGFRVTLSLELFNRKLWSQDPLMVIKTGLGKDERLICLAPRSRARHG